jgi:protein involved in polysaccharide export with SLBB domain
MAAMKSDQSPQRGVGRLLALFLLGLLSVAVSPHRSVSAQVLPRQEKSETEQKEERKPPSPRPSLFPSLSPFRGESQLLRTEEATGLPTGEDGLEAPIDPDQYRLGPGDQLLIGITARTPDAYPAVVSPDGKLFLPAAGEVAVGGLTLNEARQVITQQLERIRRAGQFSASIRLTRLRRIKIQVLGEVESPSVYMVSPLTRVVEALARAGGLTPIASRRHVQVRRGALQARSGPPGGGALCACGALGSERERSEHGAKSASAASQEREHSEHRAEAPATTEVNLETILLQGDPSQNILLETGDVIFVPRARQIVTVSGEVNRPGDYECDPGDSVATLLSRAGGASSRGAISAIQVERPEEGDRRRLLAADLTADGGALVLQDRDRIIVPRLTTVQGRLRVVGAVKGVGENWQPDTDSTVPRTADIVTGIYLLRRGDRVRDVLENVGGVTAKADGAHVRVERPDGAGGKTVFPVDLYRAMVMQDPAQNVELRDGDTLLVPKIQDKVYVTGEVPRPGEQEFVEGKTVLDYVSMAGGPGPRAKRKETIIVRTEGTEPKLIRVGLDQFLAGKKPPAELAVKPGDVMVVPSASIRGWQEWAQIAFLLRTLAAGFILFR